MIAYLYSAIIGLALASSLLLWESRPTAAPAALSAPPASESASTPTTDRESAAASLLLALGNAQPSAAIIGAVVEWSIAEDGCLHACTENNAPRLSAVERNNPWNTTQPGFNDTGCHMADCVRQYATWDDGIAATAHTLTNGLYPDVVAALLRNDPEAFKAALWASPWAASRYNGGAGWPSYQAAALAAKPAVTSNPISLAGDCGYNVQVAIEANGGALRNVRIAPGETFSFNATMGNPAAIPFVTCAGVPGGNWCNLAARYAQVARALGLALAFEDHGVGDLGGGPENSVAIWNVGGQAGSAGESQDLEITNTTSQPVTFQARVDGDQLIIEGGL